MAHIERTKEKKKVQKIPFPGMRNLKTALAAVLCFVLYELIGRDGVMLAMLAVFICMQDSVDKSLLAGKDRIIGTLLGGAFGMLIGFFHMTEMSLPVFGGVIFLGIVSIIFICSLLRMGEPIIIGLVTFLFIAFELRVSDMAPFFHALERTLDTGIGVVVAVLINLIVFRPKPEKFRGCETENPVFHYEYREAGHYKTMKWIGGYTQELYIYPEDKLYKDLDFDFRLAVSTGFTDESKFRKYPGYKRRIMILDGEMRLEHKDKHDITLGKYEMDSSLGHWDTVCLGKGTDISLLTTKDYSGKLEILRKGSNVQLNNEHFTAFYSLENAVKLTFANQGMMHKLKLNRGDCVIVTWFENGEETYTVEVDSETDKEHLVVVAECLKKQTVETAVIGEE